MDNVSDHSPYASACMLSTSRRRSPVALSRPAVRTVYLSNY